MITVTLNPDEMRDVIYALRLAEDDLQLRAAMKEAFAKMGLQVPGKAPQELLSQAALRVAGRLRRVRARIEADSAPTSGRCIHGTLFSEPCISCLGKLKGD